MISVKADDLERAIDLHKKGELPTAIRAYERFLKKSPQHAGALNLLGLAYSQKGEPDKAVPMLERALALRPDLPGGDYNLGTLLYGLKRYQQAIAHFNKAVILNPSDAEAHNSLGSAFNSIGNRDEAVKHFGYAIALRPDYAAAQYNVAKILLTDKDFERATIHYQKALEHDPSLLDAYFGLSGALCELKRSDEAVAICRRAVDLRPDNADAHCHYGAALDEAGHFDEAIRQQQIAIELDPRHAVAHFNIACSYYAQNRYSEALLHYNRAIALNLLEDAEIKSQLAISWCLYHLGRHDEAHHCLDKIIADHVSDSNGAEAKRNKGLMLLNRGNFAAGWPLYENRKGIGPSISREKRIPRWRGNKLDRKLWVWGEQGLGDHILYASMIDDLRARTNSIVLEVEPRLTALFSRSFPGIELIPMNADLAEPDIEAQTPIASLGRFLRTDWQSFKQREQGYLKADPARVAELRSRLSSGNQKIVGLSWRSVRRRLGASKSARLEDFLQILRLPGIRFVDVQYGDTSEDRARLQSATGISVTRLDDIDNTNDIDGLAALMTACDAIVSVSNTNAHLAGALGRPTWVFAPYGFSQIWYWFPEMSKSPWYSRVEVRHQGANQSWEEVISPTAAEIETFIRSSVGETS